MARAGPRTSAGNESTGDQWIGGRRASPGGGWSGGGACQAVPSLDTDAIVMWGTAVMIAPEVCDTQKAGTQFAARQQSSSQPPVSAGVVLPASES